MKKISFLLSLILLFGTVGLFTRHTFANTTPTPELSKIDEQINNLKERIASRVAQLNLVEKRGIIGTVSDVSETQLSLVDGSGANRLVDVDELTKFSSPSAKSSFGISDITKGSMIGVVGLYNKDSRRLLARWVDVLTLPTVISGGILSINTDAGTFGMATVDTDSITVNVETVTKTSTYTKNLGITKSGFSKLTIGEHVLVIGFPDAQNKNMIVASRILVFPEFPVNPKIPMIKPGDIAPVTPSTGSGKKLTPIVK